MDSDNVDIAIFHLLMVSVIMSVTTDHMLNWSTTTKFGRDKRGVAHFPDVGCVLFSCVICFSMWLVDLLTFVFTCTVVSVRLSRVCVYVQVWLVSLSAVSNLIRFPEVQMSHLS